MFAPWKSQKSLHKHQYLHDYWQLIHWPTQNEWNLLCQRNLPGLSIKLTTPNQMMSYTYPIYSGADSDHTKHLVDPQLREGESCEWLAKLCKQIVAQGPTD